MSPANSTSHPNQPPPAATGESSRANCAPVEASNTYAAPEPAPSAAPVTVESSPHGAPTTNTSSSAATETPNQSLAEPSPAVTDRACDHLGYKPAEVT